MFDPGGGEGEGVDVVGLVGVGLVEACADERLGGVGYSPPIEGFYDALQDIEDIVSVGLGCGLCRRADGVVGGDGEADGGISQTVCAGSLGIVYAVEVDKAAGPLHRGLWEVELLPVFIDVTECRYQGGETVLDGKENLFYLLSALLISSVIFFSMAAVSSGLSPMKRRWGMRTLWERPALLVPSLWAEE